jgi:hypothetical protein
VDGEFLGAGDRGLIKATAAGFGWGLIDRRPRRVAGNRQKTATRLAIP